MKSEWPQNIYLCYDQYINIRENNNFAVYLMDNHKLSKWLISLYSIENIDELINIYFRHDRIDYIRHIITEFDLYELRINPQYQSKFDDIIQDIQGNLKSKKSARK